MKQEKQRILVVEDQLINRKILKSMLDKDYEIVEAANGEEAIAVISEQHEILSGILLDIIMPVMDGYEVLKNIKIMGYTDIPVIVMTGEKDPKSEEKALDLGAWDFISKPYKAQILLSRLSNAIARSEMGLLRQMKHMAEHDDVTELYNRRHFFEITKKMLLRYRDTPFVFVKMDISRFKLINTFYGEAGGDKLLCYVAAKLEEAMGHMLHASFGRIEADIFACCFPYEKKECEDILEQLYKRIEQYDKEYLIEVNFGIYCIENLDMSAEDMNIRASMALKKCKEDNSRHYVYYDIGMGNQLFKEQQMINRMQGALDHEEFVVYFQPKYNLQTLQPYGAEALVRWRDPVKGLMPPGEFVPVFEKNGFIAKVDYYIWDKVCQYLRKWIDDGISVAPISVNMSRLDISNPNIVEHLTGLLKKYKLKPDYLNIELTESAYMDNPQNIKNVIDRLHQAGFVIMMDDFGSEYSSLNTLKDFEVDYLKIDMKFLPVHSHESKSKKILTSVVRMAGWLRLPVIVEGVETKEQADFLESIGCEYIQGYYFAKPMPAEQYEALIRDKTPKKADINSDFLDGYETMTIPVELKNKIYRDELTGAYNRRYLNEWLFLDLDDIFINSERVAIVMADIRKFKNLNDEKGHLTGDEVLVQVAAKLMEGVRAKDSVIRYGGDEFLIVLIGCPEEIVKNKINDFKKSLKGITCKDGSYIDVAADFGYSFTEKFVKDKGCLIRMIKEADERMYEDKNTANEAAYIEK